MYGKGKCIECSEAHIHLHYFLVELRAKFAQQGVSVSKVHHISCELVEKFYLIQAFFHVLQQCHLVLIRKLILWTLKIFELSCWFEYAYLHCFDGWGHGGQNNQPISILALNEHIIPLWLDCLRKYQYFGLGTAVSHAPENLRIRNCCFSRLDEKLKRGYGTFCINSLPIFLLWNIRIDVKLILRALFTFTLKNKPSLMTFN